jgi:uncharacterized protein YuzE
MKHMALKFEYDRTVDAAYLRLARGKILGSEQLQPGVIVDLGPDGKIMGVEILRFARRFQSSLGPKSSAARTKSLRKSA